MDGTGPSHFLLGKKLVDGWQATKSISLYDSAAHARSGYYRAEHPDGRRAFVKAIDFHHEEREGDLNWLSEQTTTFLNEQHIHEMLTQLSIRGIAALLHKEQKLTLPSGEVVHYFIVEWCGNDLEAIRQTNLLEMSLHEKYIILRQVCNTISKMHWNDVAHQDVRRSNTLIRSDGRVRLTDFGLSSCRQLPPPPHDNEQIVGDPMCAPYEALYGSREGTWKRQHVGCDLFLLGSLAFQLIIGFPVIQVTLLTIDEAQLPVNYVGKYEQLIPILINAQSGIVSALLADAMPNSPSREELCGAILELCHPDPDIRGRRSKSKTSALYDLQPYISLFDHIARRETLHAKKCG